MPFFAMVVVVEAPSADAAAVPDDPMMPFVGRPWAVQPEERCACGHARSQGRPWCADAPPEQQPTDGCGFAVGELDREFDTLACIDQHPER